MFIFQKKISSIESLDRLEENDSQSSSSTRSNISDRGQSRDRKYRKKHQKERTSIDRTTTSSKPKLLSEITNDLLQPPQSTTVESHFNPNEFTSPPVPARRMHSPILTASSSEIEFEEALPNGSRSTTPIPNQSSARTFPRSPSQTSDSTLNDRPPARLENRPSPISSSPERRLKSKDDTHSFFED